MITATTIPELRRRCDDTRRDSGVVALVPTMGSLHDGHRSLMRAARADADLVVVSLFVNPTQFGPDEDLDGYPHDLDGDTAAATAEDVDLLFVPSVTEMYPDPPRTTVHVDGLTDRLCGASRPTHFDGVATVVTKLFSIVGPCRAYFGRKDAQQLAVIRRLVDDLNLPVAVIGCPLVREPDGLARSSRNAYLTADERDAATVLWRALSGTADAVHGGERDGATLEALAQATIRSEPRVRLDYAELVDARTMDPAARVDGELVLAVAAFVGRARLIDNLTITAIDADVDTDLGVVAEEQIA